jgi:hypothetical protein
MDDQSNSNMFDTVLAVCKEQDGLCMDVPAERFRLARAITAALHEANVLAHGYASLQKLQPRGQRPQLDISAVFAAPEPKATFDRATEAVQSPDRRIAVQKSVIR